MAREFDYKKTILSQFANSKTLVYLIDKFWEMLKIDMDEIIARCLDMDTASGYFLDCIGKRVGAYRTVNVYYNLNDDFGFDSNEWFGFAPAAGEQVGGTFDLRTQVGQTAILNDNALRLFIKMRALRSVQTGSIGNINHLLKFLFDESRGKTWIELNDMTITINFSFYLEAFEVNLLLGGAFPMPAGYEVKLVQGAPIPN
jgi:hypothetical protein